MTSTAGVSLEPAAEGLPPPASTQVYVAWNTISECYQRFLTIVARYSPIHTYVIACRIEVLCTNTHTHTYLPTGLVEHLQLVAWAIWISDHQTWAYDVERGINVHWIRVLEADGVEIVATTEMTTHPLYPKVVSHL